MSSLLGKGDHFTPLYIRCLCLFVFETTFTSKEKSVNWYFGFACYFTKTCIIVIVLLHVIVYSVRVFSDVTVYTVIELSHVTVCNVMMLSHITVYTV